MDAKKFAVGLSIAALLPLFLVLFVDVIYTQPEYEDFCKFNERNYPTYPSKIGTNCTQVSSPQEQQCYNSGGMAEYSYDENGCSVYDSCNYCSRDYSDALEKYHGEYVFYVLIIIGLAVVITGIYFTVDYIGAGLMFAGIITMFYATARYFSELDELFRALLILAELLLIMWIGYRKIGNKGEKSGSKSKSKKKAKR